MAVPCREQLLVNAKAALQTVAGMAERVDRNRTEPLTSADLNRLALFDDGDTPHGEDESFCGERGYTLNLGVEGAVFGATDVDAKTQLAVLRASAERVLLVDPTLGGLARDVRLAAEPPPPRLQIESEQPVAAFAIGFEVDFATAEDDPFTFA